MPGVPGAVLRKKHDTAGKNVSTVCKKKYDNGSGRGHGNVTNLWMKYDIIYSSLPRNAFY